MNKLSKIRSLRTKRVKQTLVSSNIKRLYGFNKDHSYQSKRKTNIQRDRNQIGRENYLIRKEFKNNKLKYYTLYKDRFLGNSYSSYLSPYFLNYFYYKNKDINKCFTYLVSRYQDIDTIILDWNNGVRDIVWAKVMKITGADFDQDLEYFIQSNHADILNQSMLDLFLVLADYLHTNRSSFYTYVVNILPYIYLGAFEHLYSKEKKHLLIKQTYTIQDSEDYQEYIHYLFSKLKVIKIC
jgi:hypothetical protein